MSARLIPQSDSQQESLRLFIAISPPDAVCQTLRRVQIHLRQRNSASIVRWVNPEHIHLTLQFLSVTPTDVLPAISTALSRVAESSAPLSLRLGNGGCFPDARRPRVLWVGVEGDLSELYFLQQSIAVALASWSGRAEPFQPHLTLGRVRNSQRSTHDNTDQVVATFISTMLIAPTVWKVSHFDLMQSQLTPQGALYTRLTSFSLGSTL